MTSCEWTRLRQEQSRSQSPYFLLRMLGAINGSGKSSIFRRACAAKNKGSGNEIETGVGILGTNHLCMVMWSWILYSNMFKLKHVIKSKTEVSNTLCAYASAMNTYVCIEIFVNIYVGVFQGAHTWISGGTYIPTKTIKSGPYQGTRPLLLIFKMASTPIQVQKMVYYSHFHDLAITTTRVFLAYLPAVYSPMLNYQENQLDSSQFLILQKINSESVCVSFPGIRRLGNSTSWDLVYKGKSRLAPWRFLE